MGTNYYWREQKAACPTCGHNSSEELHIGKSSAGWVFALHVYPERGINKLEDWISLFVREDSGIRDEYGNEVKLEAMIRSIAARSSGRSEPQEPYWYTQNHAEPGPHNLARAQIDGRRTIGHGPGTWDYHVGEFS